MFVVWEDGVSWVCGVEFGGHEAVFVLCGEEEVGWRNGMDGEVVARGVMGLGAVSGADDGGNVVERVAAWQRKCFEVFYTKGLFVFELVLGCPLYSSFILLDCRISILFVILYAYPVTRFHRLHTATFVTSVIPAP